MNGFHAFSPWPWMKSEPDLQSLYQWLDSEAPQLGGQREWGVWGGITGASFGISGSAIGIMAGALQIDPARFPIIIAAPLTFATTISVAAAIITFQHRQKRMGETGRALREARQFTWMLVAARWQGGIKGMLGEERALALNEGARQVIRCHQALRSSSWRGVGDATEYAAVRERVGAGMDVAMARLVTLIGRGAAASDQEVGIILDEMRVATDEAIKTANRLAGLGSSTQTPSDLRQALSELRMLNDAHREVDEIVERG